jgi:tetratricopeptide (TPR) repeat protein
VDRRACDKILLSSIAQASPRCDAEHWLHVDLLQACDKAIMQKNLTTIGKAEILFYRGVALTRLGTHKYNEAREQFDQGLRLNPNHASMHRERGKIAYFDRDFTAALFHGGRATTLNPASANNWQYMGNVAEAVGDNNTALEARDQAIKQFPESPVLRFDRIKSLFQLDRHLDAEADAVWILGRPATDLSELPTIRYSSMDLPVSVATRLAYGRVLMITGKVKESHAILGEAVKLMPTAEVYVEKAESLTFINRIRSHPENVAAAVSDLKEAIRLSPQYAHDWGLLGGMHFSLEEFDKALSMMDQAIKLSGPTKTSYRLLWRRATVLRSLDRTKDAITAAEGAVALAMTRHQLAIQDVMSPMIENGYWKGDLPNSLTQSVTDAITACFLDKNCA